MSTYRIRWEQDGHHDDGQVAAEADTTTGTVSLTVSDQSPIPWTW